MNKLSLKIAKYYWTYLDSLCHRLKKTSTASNKILLCRSDGLGDFFLLVPFLQQLTLRNYSIVCAGPALNKEIIDYLSLNVEYISQENHSVKAFMATMERINQHTYAYAFNLSMNIWGGFIVNQSRAVRKIGLLQEREQYVYKGASLFYHKTFSYPAHTHSFTVLNTLFADTLTIAPIIPTISKSSTSQGTILLHPFARWKPRQWPHFDAFARKLIDNGHTIAILGTTQECSLHSWVETIAENTNCTVIAAQNISDLLKVIDSCSVFIGNDSGPAHYAALIGKPTLVVWGPGFLERIQPLGPKVTICSIPIACRPCRQKGNVCSKGINSCLEDLTVEKVWEAFRDVEMESNL